MSFLIEHFDASHALIRHRIKSISLGKWCFILIGQYINELIKSRMDRDLRKIMWKTLQIYNKRELSSRQTSHQLKLRSIIRPWEQSRRMTLSQSLKILRTIKLLTKKSTCCNHQKKWCKKLLTLVVLQIKKTLHINQSHYGKRVRLQSIKFIDK